MKKFKWWDEDAPVNATGTAVVGTGDDSSTVIVKKKKDVKVYKKKRKMTGEEIEEARNYRKEYDEYHAKPEQRERNAARLRARRQMEKWGKVKKFDKMDVHHKDNNPLNNGKDNLAVTTQNWNRSEPRLRKEESINIQERELTPKELKRREEIAQDLNDADFKKRYGDRWKEVKMGVATNMAKDESIDEADDPKADQAKAKELKIAKAIAQAQLAIAKEQERVQKLTDIQKKIKDQQKSEQKTMKEKYLETKPGSLQEAANRVYEIWNDAQSQGVTEYKKPRQLKDPKKEMLVVKKGVVIVIDKIQYKDMKKMGWMPAESFTPEEETKKEVGSKVDGRTRSYKETLRRIQLRREKKNKTVTEETLEEKLKKGFFRTPNGDDVWVQNNPDVLPKAWAKKVEAGKIDPTKMDFSGPPNKWKEIKAGYEPELEEGDKEEYQKFFQAALKKFGAKSPSEMDDEKKKKFFDYIEKNWTKDEQQVSEGELPPALKKAIAAKKAKKDGKKDDKEDEDDDPVGEEKKNLTVDEAIAGKDALDALYDIVNKKQHGKVLGVKVDLFTASAMVQVYKALNARNKDKVEKMLKDKRGVATFAQFAMSQVKR